MPFTVITLKNVSASLKGDLSKWMQEIATGVFVGNFNSKIREKLWERVTDYIGIGEATMSYSSRNEMGYTFVTSNTEQKIVDFDGIPLVLFPKEPTSFSNNKTGYSNASRYYNIQKRKFGVNKLDLENCVILDIETDGLDFEKHNIIEVAALKKSGNRLVEYHSLVKITDIVPQEIKDITGITDEMIKKNGKPLQEVLEGLIDFIENKVIIGYNINFDIRFINKSLLKIGYDQIENKIFDLMKMVKKRLPLLNDFKLQTVLRNLKIAEIQTHRALDDTKLILCIIEKLNEITE